MDFSTVYSLKDEINTYLQSNVSETKMQQLDTVIAASGQSVSSYPSSADGIMTFSTDGMEELTKIHLLRKILTGPSILKRS